MDNKVLDWVGELAGKITANKYLIAIRSAFTNVFPIVVVASLALLLLRLVDYLTEGGHFQVLIPLKVFFKMLNEGCILSLIISVVFLVGYQLGEQLQCDRLTSGVLALTNYFIVITVSVWNAASPIANYRGQIVEGVTSTGNLFAGVMIAILSVIIYKRIASFKLLANKQTQVIPANVLESVISIVPIAATVLIIGLIPEVFYLVTGQSILTSSLMVVQEPLSKLIQHPVGILLLVAVTQLLWLIGMHGANLTSIIRQPLFFLAFLTNMDSIRLGQEPSTIVTATFWSAFATQSGAGLTIGLIIAILLIEKNGERRRLVKSSIVSGLFNINEPLVFGFPLVLNKIYGIPFVLAPVVSTAIGYFGMASGYASKAFIEIPWVTPPLLNVFLATGGDIKAVILQLGAICSAVVLYAPFVLFNKRRSVQ